MTILPHPYPPEAFRDSTPEVELREVGKFYKTIDGIVYKVVNISEVPDVHSFAQTGFQGKWKTGHLTKLSRVACSRIIRVNGQWLFKNNKLTDLLKVWWSFYFEKFFYRPT